MSTLLSTDNRKALNEIRSASQKHSPEEIFYPTLLLSNGQSMEQFALDHANLHHRKRYLKGRAVPISEEEEEQFI
jgi:hypothetical protein